MISGSVKGCIGTEENIVKLCTTLSGDTGSGFEYGKTMIFDTEKQIFRYRENTKSIGGLEFNVNVNVKELKEYLWL